jgi:hypothetical protein
MCLREIWPELFENYYTGMNKWRGRIVGMFRRYKWLHYAAAILNIHCALESAAAWGGELLLFCPITPGK